MSKQSECNVNSYNKGVSIRISCGVKPPELQKHADRADQSVLFFLAGASFWEKHAKNRQKYAKTSENTRKQAKNRRFFGANFLGEKIGRC